MEASAFRAQGGVQARPASCRSLKHIRRLAAPSHINSTSIFSQKSDFVNSAYAKH